MRNMSFALTTKQIINRTKTITRRFGWWFLRPGDKIGNESFDAPKVKDDR